VKWVTEECRGSAGVANVTDDVNGIEVAGRRRRRSGRGSLCREFILPATYCALLTIAALHNRRRSSY
jgi:hypothetical protein